MVLIHISLVTKQVGHLFGVLMDHTCIFFLCFYTGIFKIEVLIQVLCPFVIHSSFYYWFLGFL